MAATLAVRDAGEAIPPTKDAAAVAIDLAAHIEKHGGVGSDRVKSIVFGGLGECMLSHAGLVR